MRGKQVASANINAENSFTDPFTVQDGEAYTVSVSGTFNATVWLQRRLDGVNWRDVEAFTVPTEKDGVAAEGQDLRLGVKTGDFTSGPAVVRLGKG